MIGVTLIALGIIIAVPKTSSIVNDNTVSTIISGEGGGNGQATQIGSNTGGGGGAGFTEKIKRYNDDGTYSFVYREHNYTVVATESEKQP